MGRNQTTKGSGGYAVGKGILAYSGGARKGKARSVGAATALGFGGQASTLMSGPNPPDSRLYAARSVAMGILQGRHGVLCGPGLRNTARHYKCSLL